MFVKKKSKKLTGNKGSRVSKKRTPVYIGVEISGKNMLKNIKDKYKKYEDDYKNKKSLLYQDLERKKYSNNEKRIYFKAISEILLQSYLICYGLRKMAEIKIEINDISRLNDIKKYIEMNKIINYYKIKRDVNHLNIYYLYLFNQQEKTEYNNNNNKNKRGIEMATKLGEGSIGDFYTCKTESKEWKKYEWRIVISCDSSEIFAQMCKFEKIADTENMKTIMDIYSKILDAFKELDSKFNSQLNPLKINIYKTKVKI